MTWRQHARASMAERIEREHYNNSETITIKVPFSLPYAPSVGNFEPVKGEFEHNGEFYKLIKQKLERDTLYVVAIRDAKEKAIFGIMSQLVKGSSQQSATSAPVKLLNELSKDYLFSEDMTIVSNIGWWLDLTFKDAHASLITQLRSVEPQPPESSC